MKKLSLALIAVLLFTAATPVASAAMASDFDDVAVDAWYYESVDYAVSNGLFNGVGEGQFSPLTPMSRAMFMTVLGRMAKVTEDLSLGIITRYDVNMRARPTTESAKLTVLAKDTVVEILGVSGGWYNIRYDRFTGYVRNDLMSAYGTAFSDVSAGEYYSPYILWAYLEGIVSGTSARSFSPHSNVNREQLCSILYNFARSYDVMLPQTVEAVVFADDAAISAYASEAVYAMQRAGVVAGRGDNSFAPHDGATRAEVAAMLKRFIEATGYVAVAPPPAYVYGEDVPESAAVANDYFDDACFIGHSLVVGMKNYIGLPNADYYGVSGISAGTLLGYDGFSYAGTVIDEYGNEIKAQISGTLDDALSESEYGKVYIMLGINEAGPDEEHVNRYAANMRSLVDLVRSSQPDAAIYLISLTPVGKERSEDSEYYNRENIIAFNAALRRVCAEKQAHYLDAFTLFADEEGYLPEDMSLSDGIHLLSGAYRSLNSYIKTHTMT